MVATTDIGTLITRLDNGRAMIAGTRTSVRRVAVLYKQGASAEEIARRMSHLNLAQVYAALAYYHANCDEVEADLAAEEADYDRLTASRRDAGCGDYTQERREILASVTREDFQQDLEMLRGQESR